MPVVSKYCDPCGIKIPIEDFEDGHALEYQQAYYCRKCKGSVVSTPEPQAEEPPPPTTPPPPPPPKRKAPTGSRIEKITGRKRASGGGAAAGGPAGAAAPVKRAAVRKPTPTAPKRSTGAGRGVAAGDHRARRAAKPTTGRAGRVEPRSIPRTRPAHPARDAREEEGIEGADKKGIRNYLIFGGIGLALTAVLIVVLVVVGRGGEKENGSPGGTSEEEARIEVIQQEKDALEDLEEYIFTYPDDLYGIEEKYTSAKRATKSEDGLARLGDVWKEAEEAAYRLLSEHLDDLVQQAKAQADDGEYGLALKTLEDVPPELKDTKFMEAVEKLKKEVEWYRKAEEDVGYYISRAARLAAEGDMIGAQGALDAINLKEYVDTPIYADVQKLKKMYRESEWTKQEMSALAARTEAEFKKLEERVKKYATPAQKEFDLALSELKRRQRDFTGTEYEEKVRELIAWVEDAFQKYFWTLAGSKGENVIGTNLLFWSIREGNTSVWDLESGVLKAELPSGGSAIGYNDNRWKDYLIEFEAKVIAGEMSLGLRLGQGASGLEYAKISLKDAKPAWKKYMFAVWGSTYYRLDPVTKEVKEIKVRQKGRETGRGAIVFILDGPTSVQIRKAVVHHIRKA